jgi:hypothetical protein
LLVILAGFTVNTAEDTADLVVEVAKEAAVVIFDGIVTVDNAMRGENLTNNWIQKDN